jgi:hypothetical protein
LFGAGILLFWVPIYGLFGIISRRHDLVPLGEAAGLIYGELRGTDLGRFTENLAKDSNEILDNVGMQILHNAKVLVRRHPSPKWESFPTTEIGKMVVCDGATGIRYFGRQDAFYTDPKMSRRDIRRVAKLLKKNSNYRSEWSSAPPAIAEQPTQSVIGPTSDPAIKFAWAEIAIEWHALANRIAQEQSDIEQIDVVKAR